MELAAPFDGMAADYDRSFSQSPIGERMRSAVWRRLDSVFMPGDRVLELNCGTGEDAVHLARRGIMVLASDQSGEMVSRARAKAERAGVTGRVEVAQLAIRDIESLAASGPFDGVLSNFGGLNCVGNLPRVARSLGALVRPGGTALLCLMGPAVPWEWGWYLLRRQPDKAVRRLRRAGAQWHGLTIRYPSIGAVRRAFAPHFTARRVAAIGALVPPTFADAWARRHPRLLAALDRCERRFETVPPLPWLADHYLLELERLDHRGSQ